VYVHYLRLLPMLVLLLAASCTNTASREECEQACKHQRQLQKASGQEDLSGGQKQGSAGLKRQLGTLEKVLAGELSRLDVEQQGRLEKAASDEERERIKEDYDNRIEAKQKEYETKFEDIREQIDEADDSTKEPSAVKEETAELEDARVVSDCADQCLERETSRDKITCRVRAANLEQFKACR